MNSAFKKKLHTALFLMLALVCIVACKKQATQPDPPPPPKDPRTYTWTIDTLKSVGGNMVMQSIWGSSPSDIYVVGHDAGPRRIVHFDGDSWQDVKLHTSEGGPLNGPFNLKRIFGFSKENIWLIGGLESPNPPPPPAFPDSTLIVHFNGMQWQMIPMVPKGSILQAIWGDSPQNLWAGGLYGTLYHYDGTAWKRKQPPKSFWYNSFAGLSANEVYALAYEYDAQGRDIRYLSMWDGTEWRILQSFTGLPREGAPFGHLVLFAIDGQLFSAGHSVFRKTTSGWENILSPFRTIFYGMHGIATDNLFAVGNGVVYHFNGNDWKQIIDLAFYGVSWIAAWTDGTEAFIVGNDGSVSYVAHGK